MDTIIVSDVHIGSPHCRASDFRGLLETLPPDVTLVLNGDTIDDPGRDLTEEDMRTVAAITAQAERRRVVWIHGNHDDNYRPPETAGIEFRRDFSIGNRLYVVHGDWMDNVMPYHRWFIRSFRALHSLRIRLGARPVHVARYAKRWSLLYGYLRRNVRMNAVEFARENGYEAVTCGHVHFAEDVHTDGVRYINTGAWTEEPTYCLTVSGDSLALRRAADLVGRT